ncbi:hypothetical protein HDU97_005843 [Phlyctochytrium planicorne]|nr:hypothetical protein HDU97_005843 [Phlyctochytrium planicorne]
MESSTSDAPANLSDATAVFAPTSPPTSVVSDNLQFVLPKGWSPTSKYGTAATRPETLLAFISHVGSTEPTDPSDDDWVSRGMPSSWDNASSVSPGSLLFGDLVNLLNELMREENANRAINAFRPLYGLAETIQTNFGFQPGCRDNGLDYLLSLLDSKTSRDSELPSSIQKAHVLSSLKSIHADLICGKQSNFRTWFLSVIVGLDISLQNQLDARVSSKEEEESENRLSVAHKWITENDTKTVEVCRIEFFVLTLVIEDSIGFDALLFYLD